MDKIRDLIPYVRVPSTWNLSPQYDGHLLMVIRDYTWAVAGRRSCRDETRNIYHAVSGSVSNVCPSCGRDDEDTHHITTCSDPGRKEMLMDSIDDLELWLTDAGTDVIIADMIVR